MTPEQCLAARRLLGWSRCRLEALSGLPDGFIRLFETKGKVSGATKAGDRLAAIRATLEAAGIKFLDEDQGTWETQLRNDEALTPQQCIEARRLVGLTQLRLAALLGVNVNMIGRFERIGYIPETKSGRGPWKDSIRAVLEAVGVEFVDENGGGASVRLRKFGASP